MMIFYNKDVIYGDDDVFLSGVACTSLIRVP